jgi:Domain of unknown function (DUF4203)
MDILTVIAGILLLILGRHLFWLFVGIVGFIAGMNLATQYLTGQSDWVIIVVGLVAGLIGAILAVLFQRIAVAVAGFLAGSYLAAYLMASLGVDMAQFEGIVTIIAGILGAILVFVLFDWALILLSSLVGSSLIVPALTADPQLQLVLFLVLAVFGILVQAGMLKRWPSRTVTR